MPIIEVCENDGNGMRTGKVTAFQIDEFYFECNNTLDEKPGYDFKLKAIDGQSCFAFDGLIIPFKNNIGWYGNKAWNGYEITANYALLLLNHLLLSDLKFSPVHIETALLRKVKKGQRITAVDVGWSKIPDEIPEAVSLNPKQLKLF